MNLKSHGELLNNPITVKFTVIETRETDVVLDTPEPYPGKLPITKRKQWEATIIWRCNLPTFWYGVSTVGYAHWQWAEMRGEFKAAGNIYRDAGCPYQIGDTWTGELTYSDEHKELDR